jgi:hypothetical protein
VSTSYIALSLLRTSDEANTLPEDEDSVLNSELMREYQEIFIVTNEWGVFHHSDLAWNSIQDTGSAPEFVTNFERELERRPGVEPHVRC